MSVSYSGKPDRMLVGRDEVAVVTYWAHIEAERQPPLSQVGGDGLHLPEVVASRAKGTRNQPRPHRIDLADLNRDRSIRDIERGVGWSLRGLQKRLAVEGGKACVRRDPRERAGSHTN